MFSTGIRPVLQALEGHADLLLNAYSLLQNEYWDSDYGLVAA
jgi:hypothetical protein